ncbi:DUF418 domain-containing protein [Saccharopolyspora hirsuta]|uniref:DUF418 domain-containing protein n=1 Tax=Saccharopolyspora hirsuta TaxID=1837 RepID=A0A5M7C5K1_SACHI|nr:ABC transporter permease [Saccharopolyspora hirsuta]KAA5837033.1 DUF418 domain-containing protein [Saccharopolyspora hirsuta]
MSSPQPPDGGQQGSDPISNRMDPQDPNQAGSDATQVVKPVQSQGQPQQPPSDSTQVVPPSMQPPQPMYQQPGLSGQSGAEATAMVPPSAQPPQPMYQQPGTQSQPGGFPAQPQQPGTPSGGFPAPQAQPGFGAQPPQAAYGQVAPQGPGNPGLAKTVAILGIVFGSLGILFGIIGILGLAAASSLASQYDVEVPSMGLAYVMVIVSIIAAIAYLVGGILLLKRKPIGPLLVGGAAAVGALSSLIGIIMYPAGFQGYFGLLFGIALAVLAFLPGTRDWAAAGAQAPVAGGFGAPQGFGQPGQSPYGQQPQQFGQPGQPGQPGGYPPPGGQQPPQW